MSAYFTDEVVEFLLNNEELKNLFFESDEYYW